MNGLGDIEADLNPVEVANRMVDGDLLLIDVREDYEWNAGRVPGSRHVPLVDVASQSHTLPKDRPIAFICLAGVRSAMVAKAFRDAGYDAYNVAGGFAAWFGRGLPTEPDNAEVAPH